MLKNILVTGGGGYIGNVLVNELLKSGYNVGVLDNFKKDNMLPQHTRLSIFNGDINDTKLLIESTKNQHAIIHLAGISDGRAGRIDPELTRKVNLEGFKKLIQSASGSGASRFINMSTFGVYGTGYAIPLTEDIPLNPEEPYSETKAQTEQIANGFNSGTFITTNIRLAMVFGWSPQMRFDFLVNTLIKDAIEKKSITILGGQQIRPQIHILDVSRVLIGLLKTEREKIAGQTFNLGTINKTLQEIVDEIATGSTEKININYKEVRSKEHSFILDSEKINKIFALKEHKSVAFALKEIKFRIYGMG